MAGAGSGGRRNASICARTDARLGAACGAALLNRTLEIPDRGHVGGEVRADGLKIGQRHGAQGTAQLLGAAHDLADQVMALPERHAGPHQRSRPGRWPAARRPGRRPCDRGGWPESPRRPERWATPCPRCSTASKSGSLSSCKSLSYELGSPFSVISSPVSRPVRRPAFPRNSSAASGFFFCGIRLDPVLYASARVTKPNSRLLQRIRSSAKRLR